MLRLPRAEWPRWKPSMPLSWMLPAHSGAGSYAGRAIAIAVLPLNDLFVLQARRLDPLDDLSPRERDVANGLLEGLSYKEIATHLGLACSTVTNHVNRIDAKLGVHNGVQLVG